MRTAWAPRVQNAALNIATVFVGLALAFSPWLMRFPEMGAIWSARLLGAAIAVTGIRSLIVETEWEDFGKMALGIWAAISPAILSFTHMVEAALAHLLLGGTATCLAVASLRLRDVRRFQRHRRLRNTPAEDRPTRKENGNETCVQ